MATESPMRVIGNSRAGKWVSPKDAASFASPVCDVAATDELRLLLRGHKDHGNHSSSVPNRSGSAPPSMEGSFAAFSNLTSQQRSNSNASLENFANTVQRFESEEQLRADPSYLAYYSSHVNLNPRLPPPIVSRENRLLARNIGASGKHFRSASSNDNTVDSLRMPRNSLSTHIEEPEDENSPQQVSVDRVDHNIVDMTDDSTVSMAGRHKSLVDIIQEDFPRTPSPVYTLSRSSSHATAEEPTDLDHQALALNSLSLGISKTELKAGSDTHSEVSGQHDSIATDDSSLVSLPKDAYREPLVTSLPSQLDTTNKDACNVADQSTSDATASDVSKSLFTLETNINKEDLSYGKNVQQQSSQPQLNTSSRVSGSQVHRENNLHSIVERIPQGHPRFPPVEVQPVPQAPGMPPPLYATAAAYMASASPFHANLSPSGAYAPQYSMGGYAFGSTYLPPYMAGYPAQAGLPFPFDGVSGHSFTGQSSGMSPRENISQVGDLQSVNKFYGQHGLMMHPSFTDPVQMQYFQRPSDDAYGIPGQYVRLPPTGVVGNKVDPHASHKDPHVPSYIVDPKFQSPTNGSSNISSPMKVAIPGTNYYGSPAGVGFMPQFPPSPLGSPVLPGSPVRGITAVRGSEGRFSPGSIRNVGSYSGWNSQRGYESFNDSKRHSLLEELKASNTRKFDLSDITGHIAEFSVDQHGSRFIQQKLETCSVDDKESVFKEVLPHASKLITDVFGNYVIQKFFEHGSREQRKELANQLSGQMLPLSLQMYGCRVIQKALEVIELDQKTELVHELDGHVMRCVRDQNGNHVVQKCIECVPTEKIGFIISSFKGQVSTLSTHPYGCRVIQRVLEHCSDDPQSQCIVDEILESAYDLAQDQYGNYVTQHVLERGKPRERSQIISKLSGKIVQLSQHKYASNVVEKCLEYGDSTEREILIEEILAQSEGNDSLLTMMKDQFANYVVQKILEISSGAQREVLLSRMRVHLQALRKYTYGKHIVARFEQLTDEDR